MSDCQSNILKSTLLTQHYDMSTKRDLLEELKAKREDMKNIRKDLRERQKAFEKRNGGKTSPEVNDALEEIDALIEEANRIQSQNGRWADFVKAVKKFFGLLKSDGLAGVAAQATLSAVGHFVNKYLNKGIRRELVNVAFKPPRQKWGRLSLETSLALSVKVGLIGDANLDIVVIKGAAGGFATFYAALSLDAGFTIPIANRKVDCVITGGIDGKLSATAGVAISLTADGANLKGKLSETIVNTELESRLFLEIPQWVVDTWNAVAKISFGKLSEISSTRIERNSGVLQLFKVVIPGYDVTFNIKSCEFGGAPSGGFSFVPGADVQAMIAKAESYLPWKR